MFKKILLYFIKSRIHDLTLNDELKIRILDFLDLENQKINLENTIKV